MRGLISSKTKKNNLEWDSRCAGHDCEYCNDYNTSRKKNVNIEPYDNTKHMLKEIEMLRKQKNIQQWTDGCIHDYCAYCNSGGSDIVSYRSTVSYDAAAHNKFHEKYVPPEKHVPEYESVSVVDAMYSDMFSSIE
jgi:hypothetical protein